MANEIQTVNLKPEAIAVQTNNLVTSVMGNSESWKMFMNKFPQRRQEAILFDVYAYVNKNAETVSKMNVHDFMGRVVDCYSQGFNLQDGDAYILPFRDGKTGAQVATLVPGYKGTVRLAMQTGLFKHFDCAPVIRESIKKFDYKRNVPVFDESYIPNGSEKVIGYLAYSETHDGMIREIYHPIEYFKDFAIRKSPQSRNAGKLVGVWATDFDAMCKKTALKELGKLAPKVKNPTEQQTQFFNYVEAENEMQNQLSGTSTATAPQLDRPQNIDVDGVVQEKYNCSVCGKEITAKRSEQSIAKYGVPLCSKECMEEYMAHKDAEE